MRVGVSDWWEGLELKRTDVRRLMTAATSAALGTTRAVETILSRRRITRSKVVSILNYGRSQSNGRLKRQWSTATRLTRQQLRNYYSALSCRLLHFTKNIDWKVEMIFDQFTSEVKVSEVYTSSGKPSTRVFYHLIDLISGTYCTHLNQLDRVSRTQGH